MPAVALRPSAPAPSPAGTWLGDNGHAWIDRLPRFAGAMAASARALTESLGALAASPGEVRFKGARSCRVDDLQGRDPGGAVLALARAPGWDATLAFDIGQALVTTLLQAMFGAAEDDADAAERRVLTPLERRIAEILADHAAEALTKGCADVLPSSFDLEPAKAKPDLSRLGKPNTALAVVDLEVRFIGPPVTFAILIPLAALEAFETELAPAHGGEPASKDPQWVSELETGISRTQMKLRARLSLPTMTLGQIADLKAGQVLPLAHGTDVTVILSSGGTDLFRCELGQTAGFYSLRVGDDLAAEPSPHKHR